MIGAWQLEALTFGSVALLGGKGTLFAWFVASSTFYFSTWETYHTHTLLLQPFNGPTEGLLLMYTAEIATAFVGRHPPPTHSATRG